MGTNGVGAVPQVTFRGQTYSVAQLKNLIDQNVFAPEIAQEAMNAVKDAEKGIKVQTKAPEAGDAEKAKQAAAANDKAVADMDATKKQAAQFNAQDNRVVGALANKDEAKFARDTKILKEGLGKIDTKEKAMEAGFTKKTAKRVAKAASKNIGSIDKHNAVEKIFTNKEEYNKAVKEAKENGTWDKKLPKYTLLEGKQLEAAKTLQQKAENQVLAAKATFAKYRALTEQYNKTDLSKLKPEDQAKLVADRIKADNIMKGAAMVLAKNYNASQMFDKDGNLNTNAFKNTMLEYAGSDFKGNLDERKVLQKSSGLSKKRHTKDMYKAAGLDVEKDYTWAMKAGVAAAGVGAGALAGLLGGGAIAQTVATATATASASATATATAKANAYAGEYVHWEASNGEEFEKFVEAVGSKVEVAKDTVSTTVTETATKIAEASVSRGQQALRGAIGALPAAILAGALAKDNGGKDVFNGASAQQVLESTDDRIVRKKYNREIVDKIKNMPNLSTEQKAAILESAYAQASGKKVNTRELVSAYTAAQYLNDHPELVNPEPIKEGTTTQTTPTNVTEECKKEVFDQKPKAIQLPKDKKGIAQHGRYWVSRIYVDANGKPASEADRKQIEAQLKGHIAINKKDGSKIQVPPEITINGKTFRPSDDPEILKRTINAKDSGKGSNAKSGNVDTRFGIKDCNGNVKFYPSKEARDAAMKPGDTAV